jgi:hypothetical protein
LLKRQLPSPRGFFKSVWGSTGDDDARPQCT